MIFLSPDKQRQHILQGEQDVKDWKEWESTTQADLITAEKKLSRNPHDPTLKRQHDAAATKAKNVSIAREQREKSVEAAKHCFGWSG